SDAVDGSLQPTCTPPSGSTFAPGATTVTCHATDAAGNTGDASFTVTVAVDQASGEVEPGGTVTTGNAPSPDDPVESSVTSPNAGAFSIVEEVTTGTPPSGFEFLGYEAVIHAPAATAADPLILEFMLDGSLLPAGVDASNVVVWRNGVAVPPCNPGSAASP